MNHQSLIALTLLFFKIFKKINKSKIYLFSGYYKVFYLILILGIGVIISIIFVIFLSEKYALVYLTISFIFYFISFLKTDQFIKNLKKRLIMEENTNRI